MREYAKHRGVTVEAVSKAVKTKRISLTGKKVDVARADAQWSANTQPGQRAAKQRRKAASKRPQAPLYVPEPDPNSYASARARREQTMADLARLDFEKKAGILINAEEAKAEWFKLITEAKTRLLGVAAKCRNQCPSLSPIDISIIEGLIREELEELANATAVA